MDSLELPPFPAPHIAGPARAGACFVVAGRHAVVTGTEAAGIEEARIHPTVVMARLRIRESEPARAARSTATGFERLLVVDGRELLERVFVPPTGAGFILEWHLLPPRVSPGACFDPLDLELEWACPIGPSPRIEVSARRLLVHAAQDGGLVAFATSRAVSGGARGGAAAGGALLCALGVRLVPGERLAMTVAAAPDAGALESALADLTNAPVLARAAAGDADRRATASLVLGAPDPEAGMAVRWAIARLPGFLIQLSGSDGGHAGEARPQPFVTAAHGPGVPPRASERAALRLGLAALAAGDFPLALEVARAALALAHGDPRAGAGALLLFARHFLWTGDPAPAADAWPQLRQLAGRAQAAASADGALAAAALGQLALAAESLGRAEDAAAFRAAGARLARADTAVRALADAGGWGAWAEGGAGGAYRAWRERAAVGLHPAKARWPGPGGPDDASATAAVINGVACGVLGIEPDAPRSRLRLRPQLPADWEHVEVRGIRTGDAEVLLRHVAADGNLRFQLEQVSGGVPLRVVLEPAVAGTLTAARVDGRPASLVPQPFGERFIVPVQVVLDDVRVVELDVQKEARRR